MGFFLINVYYIWNGGFFSFTYLHRDAYDLALTRIKKSVHLKKKPKPSHPARLPACVKWR